MKVLDAKIRAPLVPDWAVARPRLTGRVLGSRARVVLLVAPAGYGKSLLAAQISAAGETPAAWLHVDRADTDPRRFCRHLVAALAEALPALGRTELPGQVDSGNFRAEPWLEDVLHFMQRGTRAHARLVLDNLESVLGDEAVAALIERLVAYGPPALRIILTTRVRPPFGIARMAERGEVLILGPEDLAFDLAEFEQAVRARGAAAGGESLEAWWTRTGGWPVALGLERMGVAHAATAEAHAGSTYVEDEILGRLPPDLLRVLRATCLFGSVSAESLSAAGEAALDDAALHAQLAASGIPHMRLAGGGVRIHPWIREILLASLKNGDPAGAEAVAASAARWFAGQGRYDLATAAWIDAGFAERALELIVNDGDRILELNLAPQIERWIAPLPPKWRTHPLYAVCLTRSYVASGKLRQLAAYVEELQPHMKRLESSPQHRFIWKALVQARQATARGPAYEELAAQWTRMRTAGHEASVGIEIALGVAALYELRFDACDAHFQTACDIAKESPRVLVDLMGATGVVLVERGRPRDALVHFEAMLAASDPGGDQRPFALLNIASVRRDQGRYRDVLDTVARSEAAARESGVGVYHTLPHVHYFKGESLWNLGRRHEAVAELEKAWQAFQENSRLDGLSAGATLDHYRALLGEAADRVTDADFDSAPACEARIRHLIGTSRRCAIRGDVQAARERAALARTIAADMPHMQASAWFTEAWAEYGCGSREAARAALSEGLAILGALDRPTYPMADPVLTAWIVAQSAAHGVHVERALQLTASDAALDLHDAFAEAMRGAGPEQLTRLAMHAARLEVRGLEDALVTARAVPAAVRDAYAAAVRDLPPPPVRVIMLGTFQCTLPGGEVRFARKASRRVFEILLLENPRPVHEERFAEALWPDTDPARGRHRLQTAVNDLRRALDPHGRPHGPTAIGYRDEHYRLELPAGSWVDYHALRERLDALRREVGNADPADPQERARGLLDAYTGELLADTPYSDEAAEPRERLRARLLDAVAVSLQPVVRAARESALPLIERALEIDGLWAEGVTMKIALLRQLGRPAAALRAYGEYETRLERELGVKPEEAMRGLAEGTA